MAVKKTIAIVGATGRAGTAIATRLSAECRLLLIAQNTDKLTELAAEITHTTSNAEVEIMSCAKEGCWEADIIILAIPYYISEKEVAGKIKEVATQKIIIRIISVNNITSFYPEYLEELQRLLPYSKIVTVFINVADLSKTTIMGRDEEAIETVVNIAAKAGLQLTPAAQL